MGDATTQLLLLLLLFEAVVVVTFLLLRLWLRQLLGVPSQLRLCLWLRLRPLLRQHLLCGR